MRTKKNSKLHTSSVPTNSNLPSDDPSSIAKQYGFLDQDYEANNRIWNWIFTDIGFRLVDVAGDGNCGYHASVLGLCKLKKFDLSENAGPKLPPSLNLRKVLHSQMKEFTREEYEKKFLCENLGETWDAFVPWIDKTWNNRKGKGKKFFGGKQLV